LSERGLLSGWVSVRGSCPGVYVLESGQTRNLKRVNKVKINQISNSPYGPVLRMLGANIGYIDDLSRPSRCPALPRPGTVDSNSSHAARWKNQNCVEMTDRIAWREKRRQRAKGRRYTIFGHKSQRSNSNGPLKTSNRISCSFYHCCHMLSDTAVYGY